MSKFDKICRYLLYEFILLFINLKAGQYRRQDIDIYPGGCHIVRRCANKPSASGVVDCVLHDINGYRYTISDKKRSRNLNERGKVIWRCTSNSFCKARVLQRFGGINQDPTFQRIGIHSVDGVHPHPPAPRLFKKCPVCVNRLLDELVDQFHRRLNLE